MKFQGKIFRDGKFWLAELPYLELMTQGFSKKEVLYMVEDLFKTLVDKPTFEVNVKSDSKGNIEVGSNDIQAMICILLQRRRQISGLTLSQVAERLGVSSRNSYARYEQGKTMPSIEKLNELLKALSPNSDFVITQSNVL